MADTIVQIMDDHTEVIADGASLLGPLIVAAQLAASDADADRIAAQTAAASVTGAVQSIADNTDELGTSRFTAGLLSPTSGSLGSATTAYGYMISEPSRLRSIQASFTATGTGFIIIWRSGYGTTQGRHRADAPIPISYVANTNTFDIADTEVLPGDFWTIQCATGGFLRLLSSTVPEIGAQFVGLSTSGPATGEFQPIGSSPVKPAMQATLTKSSELNAAVATAKDNGGIARAALSGATTTIGVGTLPAGTVASVITYSLGPKDASPIDGILEQVRIRTKTLSGAVGQLLIVYRASLVVSLVQVTGVTDANGWVTYNRQNFGNVNIAKGDEVQVYAADLDSAVSLVATGGPVGRRCNKSTFAIGDSAFIDDYTGTVCMEVTIAELRGDNGRAANNRLAQRTPLFFTNFPGTTLPSLITTSGTWTVNDGLTAPATGGWDKYAILDNNHHSSLSKREFSARIIPSSLSTSIVGICAKPTENSGGAVAMLDFAAGFLRFYSWDGTTTPGLYDTQVALPTSQPAGSAWMLTVVKDGLKTTITATNSQTQASCSLSEDHDQDYRQWHGQAGILNLAGANLIDWFQMDALVAKKCRALIITDSIGEGIYLDGGKAWPYLISALRADQNDVVLALRAGDETPNYALRRTFDTLSFQPEFGVWGIGTNDTVQSTWRTATAQFISDIIAAGGEPILCTQLPRPLSQSLRDAMNADIMGGYFNAGAGRRIRYIDMAAAVSLNNDRVTWNPALDSGDHVHPNAAGELKMLQQALIDAPFIV